MGSRGRRYNGGRKLNIKKVIAVIIAIAVIIMFIIGIKKLLTSSEKTNEKTVATKYFAVYTNEKWGVIDSKGNEIIMPTYDEAIIVPDNAKPVFICTFNVDYANNTYSTKVSNEKNEEIFTGYETVEPIENYDSNNNLWYEKGVLKVKKDGKYGLIDFKGTQILPCEYSSITALKGTTNSLITEKDGKKGIVDNLGSVMVENKYAEIKAISEKYEDGYIVKDENKKCGVILYNRTIALETKYEEIKQTYGNGKYVVKEDGKWQIVDTEGNIYLKEKFDDVKSINGDYVVVKKDGKYGVMSISGENTIKTDYQDITYAFADKYIVNKDNKYGIIDITGTTLINFNYTNLVYRETADFIEGTTSNYESDLIDRELNIKLTGIVSEINTQDGYIKLVIDGEDKYYNFKFEEKTNIELLKDNTLFLSKKDDKYGFVDKNGNVVVNYIYDDATEQNEFGFASVKKDGLWGAIDSKGEIKVAPVYKLENNILVDFIGKWHLAEDLNLNYYTDR